MIGGKCPNRRIRLIHIMRFYAALVVITMIICIVIITLPPAPSRQDQPPYVRHQTYITVEVEGRRLGNILFEYASLVCIAKQHNMTAVMPIGFPLAEYFNIKAPLVKDMQRTLGTSTHYEEYGRRASAYDRGVERLAKINTLLQGYFQSFLYFEKCAKEVADQFKFKPHLIAKGQTFLNDTRPPTGRTFKYTRVGLHVRRGDLTEKYFQDYGYTTASAAYFTNAMAFFNKKYPFVQFIVCSDDIPWCKANIQGSNVIYSEGHQATEDLAILSLCDHTIISVGSFGWWAAWLANGTTVYYDKWPRPFTKLEYNVEKKEYFPNHWIPMTDDAKV